MPSIHAMTRAREVETCQPSQGRLQRTAPRVPQSLTPYLDRQDFKKVHTYD